MNIRVTMVIFCLRSFWCNPSFIFHQDMPLIRLEQWTLKTKNTQPYLCCPDSKPVSMNMVQGRNVVQGKCCGTNPKPKVSIRSVPNKIRSDFSLIKTDGQSPPSRPAPSKFSPRSRSSEAAIQILIMYSFFHAEVLWKAPLWMILTLFKSVIYIAFENISAWEFICSFFDYLACFLRNSTASLFSRTIGLEHHKDYIVRRGHSSWAG